MKSSVQLPSYSIIFYIIYSFIIPQCSNANKFGHNNNIYENEDEGNYYNLRSSELLENTNHKVIGGAKARINEFPYFAQIDLIGNSYRRYRSCGATIIHEMFVLTAAHCLVGEGTKRVIVAIKSYGKGFKVYKGVKNFIHEEYNNSKFGFHDIGLLQLAKPLDLNKVYLKKASLPRSDEKYDRYRATVIGFGLASHDPKSLNDLVLMKAEVSIEENSDCELEWGMFYDGKFQICAGGEWKGTDPGDSGGPLILHRDGKDVVIGVASKSDPSVLPKATLYARISYYREWIDDTIESNKPYSS